MPTMLYYTQGIRDFQVKTIQYSEERLDIHLVREKQRCPRCGRRKVTLEDLFERDVRGLPMGQICEVHLIYMLHRIYCHHCHERSVEVIPFISHAKARLTVGFERTILNLREQVI